MKKIIRIAESELKELINNKLNNSIDEDATPEMLSTIEDDYGITKESKDVKTIVKQAVNNFLKLVPIWKKVDIIFVKNIGDDTLGRFKSGTATSIPVVLLSEENIKNACDEYNVSLDTAIETTIYHELFHGMCELEYDVYGYEYLEYGDEEEYVEELTNQLYDDGTIPQDVENFIKVLKKDKLKEDKIPGGKAKGMSLAEIAKHHNITLSDLMYQIRIGIKIEMEHTDDADMAMEIAKDHLMEDPEYYTNKKSKNWAEKELEKELVAEENLDEKLMLSDFNEYAKLVAKAYEEADDYDSSVVSSYKALMDSIKKMFKQLQSKVKVEFVDYDPYKTRDEMAKDVKESGVLKISKLFNEHPLYTEEENLMLRAVHDYYTHIIANQDFGLRGELRAYNTHARLAPPAALPALFTEIVGQVCYAIVNGDFGKQKIAKLDGFDYRKVGEVENMDIVNKKLVSKELTEEELYEAEFILESSNKFEYIENKFEYIENNILTEAEYKGKNVPLGKPMRGDVKKYKVYVKNDNGNVVKVNFGDPNMEIKRDDPKRRKAFRDRHNCSDKKDRTTAGYWSCKLWSNKSVSDILKGK